MVWGSCIFAAEALKTPTRNGYTAQGVNLRFNTYSGETKTEFSLEGEWLDERSLYVEYAGRGQPFGISFILSLFCASLISYNSDHKS